MGDQLHMSTVDGVGDDRRAEKSMFAVGLPDHLSLYGCEHLHSFAEINVFHDHPSFKGASFLSTMRPLAAVCQGRSAHSDSQINRLTKSTVRILGSYPNSGGAG